MPASHERPPAGTIGAANRARRPDDRSGRGVEMPDGSLQETSYGGAVLRGDELLVIRPAGRRVTGLPKGGMNPGESPEQTATREILEETGVVARLRAPLGEVSYWYRRGGRRVRKTVHFFVFDYVEGSTADHDHEVDWARWIPLASAGDTLSYPGERALIAKLQADR